MKKRVCTLMKITTLGLLFFCSSSSMGAIFDWRTMSAGSGSVNGNSYVLTESGITVTASAYVAELSGGSSQVHGPFFTSTNPTQFGFVRNSAGLGLQVATGSTSAPISGTERCCGLIRPGFNSDFYLSGDESIEAMNFALFEFDTPVLLNTLTVDDVSNFSRGSWLATGSTAPNVGGSIENTLTGYSIFNAPDTEASDGEFTTVFSSTDSFTYLLIGAPPSINIAGIEGPSGQQFYIQSIGVSPVPLPAAFPLFATALLGIIGLSKASSTSREHLNKS